MNIEGMLLNADSIIIGGSAAIRLWLKTEDGKTALALDRHFEPYFYMRNPPADVDKAEGFVRSEKVKLRLFGREVDLSRITVKHPGYVPKLRSMGESYEADIPFEIRYIIDKQITPMGWVRIGGEAAEGFIEINRIEPIPREDIPPLKIFAFDIESYEKGTSFIAILGAGIMKDGKPIIKQFVSDPSDSGSKADKKTIEDFVKYLKEEDPDIIVTYNGDTFDWPYLHERAEECGIKLDVGRDGSEPISHKGALSRISVTGRVNIDLYRIVERNLGEIKIKTLKNVAEALGVMRTDERIMIPHEQISDYWEGEERRRQLIQYNKEDVISTLGLAEKLLPLQYELSRMIKQPLDEVTKMGRGRQVEWFLINEAFKVGELAPNKHEYGEESMYEGGFVLKPKPGLHENIVALDFGAMYPSIMISYNISPDTFIPPRERAEGFYQAPEVGHRFRKSPDGFFKRIIHDLVSRRMEMKKKLKIVPSGVERNILDIRQQSIKILTNSFYGYMGWMGARWYRKECAEATTAWGRYMIKEVMARAQAQGIEVFYGDTDSVFCSYSDKIPEFVKKINDEFPVDLEIQDIYKVLFFTGAKKRYAGLTTKDEVIVKGLEVRRGDWCELAKTTQQNVIEILLRQRDPKAAVEYVKDVINRLRNGQYSLDELTIYKTMTRAAESYETKQAHVAAVKKALEEGYEIGEGKIGYVVLAGKGLVSQRTKITGTMKPADKPDIQYYIEKQVLPVALRILEYFGYKEEDLKGAPKQEGLDRWF